MRLVVVEGIDPVDIARGVATGTYEKGVQYAQRRAVLHMEWDDTTNTLRGVVQGSRGVGTRRRFTSRPAMAQICSSWGVSAAARSGSTASTSLPRRSPPPAR